MNKLISAIALIFIAIQPLCSDGCARPDNFLLSLDKDIRLFGIGRKRKLNSDMSVAKNTKDVGDKMKSTDDVDRAEESIFHRVQSVEKSILNTAGALIHDEVDVLFGSNHGSKQHQDPVVSGRRRGNDSKISSSKKVEKTNNFVPKRKKRDVSKEPISFEGYQEPMINHICFE